MSACGFEPPWGAAQRAQAAAVRRATPAELHATPEAPDGQPRKPVRTLKLRAHATPRYASEVVDWPKQLAELLEDANEVLAPTASLRVEIGGTTTWAPPGEEDLSALVGALEAADPGQDVDWVVGLVGSVPRFEQSFQKLGMARTPGKHLVMRAMNDAREYEAIEHSFPSVDAADRHKLYRARRRHKTATVFLHELAHTLGVPHELDAATIMHGRYGAGVKGFSEPAAALMRLELAHRLEPAAQTEQAFASALLAHVQSTSASWVPDERDALLARLQATAQPPQPPPRRGRPRPQADPAPPDPPPGPVRDPLAALTLTDRNTFNHAVEDQRAGKLRDAWAGLKPLFTAYPDVVAVQDLRCQLAMAMGGAWNDIQAQCAPLMALTKTPGSKKRAP
jgi:hypothetical protein